MFEIVDGRRRRRPTTDDRNLTTKNLGLIGHAVSKKKMFENNGYVHVYSPGQGQQPMGSNLFHYQYYSVNIVLCCKISSIK